MGQDATAGCQSEEQRTKTNKASGGHDEFQPHSALAVGHHVFQLRPALAKLFHNRTLVLSFAVHHQLLEGLLGNTIDFTLDNFRPGDA